MNAPKIQVPELTLGQVVRGDRFSYRVIERVGRGGNSIVYLVRAIDGELKGLLFALKLLVRTDKEDRVERFAQETRFLAEARHPSIMTLVDSGTFVDGPAQRYPFLVAEYLPKTLLDSSRSGLLIVDKATFTLQLLSGLRYLAAQTPEVVHRDIKPENIFVKGRSCILGDFGLFRGGGDVEGFGIGDLSVGVRFPRTYPTPELVEAAKDRNLLVTAKSDVFQLGLVLCEMFTGSLPLERREKPTDPVRLLAVGEVPGAQGRSARSNLIDMLNLDPVRRPSADEIYDSWEGYFSEVVKDAQRLEGRAFW